MPRNFPGTIKREAPPGPTMTEAEFKAAMEQLAQDAARWRWLRTHWCDFLEKEPPRSGSQLALLVDAERAR